MAFIELSDYKTQLRERFLMELIQSDLNLINQAEKEAIQTVTDYLLPQYDTDVIFAATGDDRNFHLLRHVKNIVLYIIYQRLPANQIPEIITENYSATLEYMTAIRDGDTDMNLPRKTDENDKSIIRFKWGSATKRSISEDYL